MTNEKIAILVDSGSDISEKLKEGMDVYSLPLRVTIDNNSYTDGLDITSKQVYQALDTSKVTSSLPSGEDIERQLHELKEQGYTHIIAILISSGLSGTYNVVRLLSEKEVGLTVAVYDTKNISLGCGFIALETARYVKEGHSFDEALAFVDDALKRGKVYFTVGNLEYLQRGGRIGLVAGTVANVLNIKPVISCNEDGIYYTITKVRGFKRSIQKMIDVAAHDLGDSKHYRVTLINADTSENLEAILNYAKERFPYATSVEFTDLSPTLGIHTGPEAVGIGTYRFD
ncbi:hypothetical protein AOC36_02325 [Erysipelothrix larvae]|uniref:Fatty acid-binding protein DegV n=1 Tax=Erysipelothrix larvae TaxID=1514105 RepID=A0A0X8GYQ1_9FIRM|nr:DegV family protein [Erysipelothrix larvae]AMC92860.1 hypothetical protein AOC36_02325 [Erysipelothrix larvae]